MKHARNALAMGLFVAARASAADGADDLGAYLVDIRGGSVAAHEILGLPKSAVSELQSPKDLVAALSTATGDAAKTGFGLAVTPARTALKPFAMSIGDYATGGPLKRLWGSTTFSYARGRKTLDALEYQQDAYAMQVNYYLRAEEDPVIAARREFVKCAEAFAGTERFVTAVDSWWEQREAALGRPLTRPEKDALKKEIEDDVLYDTFKGAGEAARKCVADGYKKAKDKWNASQVGLTLGKGWIEPRHGGARHELGRHLALSVGWGLGPHSLVNATVRRVREVDLTTVAAVPAFASSTLVGLRYTYGYSDRETFVLAEASNAKDSRPTEANSAFKYALGVDRKLPDGMWLEIRVGRSRKAGGSDDENKVLFNLKFSPESGLAKLIGG